ncbi:hypothetical protein E1293_38310 [Actinomadura darangshiensis]|uniref:Putative Flp pilus-assembly TadG-like N-terminal domain-containing protein n=1 Tax=Actinomadura darangshiensis TaxID=705336 RepID=A0A4R5A6I4_9ACTN|nr:pilus assembly protein TadG-related protein [Actinomadura darangshiensis]TDD67235.1 hypothetical protein E1293_38310 [Actinomadura darangshiensis]
MRRDYGQATAFAVVMISALVFVTGLVLDGGLVLSARLRALGQAQEAARAGARTIDLLIYRQRGQVVLDQAKAAAAARAYLATAGATGNVRVAAGRVIVTVHRVQRTQILAAIGIVSINVRASASARPVRGITTEIP